jgi:trehalose utilization protein
MKSIRLLLVLFGFLITVGSCLSAPIRVLVWDERQPAQKQVYTNFLGNEIATYLRRQPGLTVKTACLDDPEQGLAKAALDGCDVLVWWGHIRNGEVSFQTGREIVRRIKAGELSLVVLHSAHWSAPFVEAMRDRAREDALRRLPTQERAGANFVETNLFSNFRTPPKYTDRLTPEAFFSKPADGPVEISLTLPNCCFPAYRADGQPSSVRVLLPEHPIARGIPQEFTIDQTEMYNEPFHVPEPDAVVLEERWKTGEWFRSGCIWNIGRGKVFYFRPGHEVYPAFKNENVLRLISNAVAWLGERN